MIASFDCKFKTNRENIESILQHYGLRKIQSSLYAGDLNNNERKDLGENISKIIKENDNVLIMSICQSCYLKKETYGRKIKFSDELYKVYRMKLILEGYNKSIHKKDNQLVHMKKTKK